MQKRISSCNVVDYCSLLQFRNVHRLCSLMNLQYDSCFKEKGNEFHNFAPRSLIDFCALFVE